MVQILEHRRRASGRQISREVDNDATHEKEWAIKCLNHLETRINRTERVHVEWRDIMDELSETTSTMSLGSERGASLPPSSSQNRTTELVIRNRVSNLTTEEIWERSRDLIERLTRDHVGMPDERDIAYRVFDTRRCHSEYSETRGDFRCSNWRNFDHGGRRNPDDAKDYVEGACYEPSDFICFSTSPLRAWNFLDRYRSYKNPHVAVIDLGILRRLGIAYGSTTDDLNLAYHNPRRGTGVKFATKHLCLAAGWLPFGSVIGLMSHLEFQQCLGSAGMLNEDNEYEIDDYDVKIPMDDLYDALEADDQTQA